MLIAALISLALTTAPTSDDFDAEAAWTEFEELVRETYAYSEKSGEEALDAQLARSKALALEAKDGKTFRRLIHQTALTFNDPHFIIGPFDNNDYSIIYTSSDLAISRAGRRYVVSDVRQNSAAFAAGIRPGWELRSVEGVAVTKASKLPYGDVIGQPTQRQLAYGATLAANGRRGQERRLTFNDNDGRRVKLELPSPSVLARNVANLSPVEHDRLGPRKNVGMIRLNNSLGNNDVISAFDAAISELNDTDGLIIDLRNTPSGGNTDVARSMIGHFIREPRPMQRHTMPVVERTTTVPREWVEYVIPRQPYYSKPVVVLHSRWTGSMGEGLVIGFDAAVGAHTIGSDMGDLLGGLWNFDLDHAPARIDMAGEALFHVDGTPREDYVAKQPLDAADTAPDGTDPALAAALKHLSER